MDFLLVILIFVVLYQCKYVAANDTFLSKESTLSMKGICALLIVFHHLSYYERSGFLFPVFLHIGYLVVGFFFMISGYGLTLQYAKSGQGHYWITRFLKLLLPYLIAAVVYYLINLEMGVIFSFADPISRFSRGMTLVPYSWYIFATVIFYGLFALSCFLSRNNRLLLLICLTVSIACYCVILFLLGFPDIWIKSAFALPLGAAICVFKDRFTAALQNHYWKVSAFCFSAFVSLFLLAKIISSYYIIDNFSVLFFCISVLAITYRLKINNPITRWLGTYSYEIYLYHGCFVLMYQIGHGIVYGSLSLLLSLLAAYLMQKINRASLRFVTGT